MNTPLFSYPQLGEPTTWKDPVLWLREGTIPVCYTMQDVFAYHGFDAPGGVVLGFRLLQRAFALLAPNEEYPDRRKLSLFTSFPGLGLKDTVEYITRMATDSRYTLDQSYDDPRAPEGVAGRFYYRFDYEGKSVELAPALGYPPPEFIRLGKASGKADFSAEDAKAWIDAKNSLATTLLSLPADIAVRIL